MFRPKERFVKLTGTDTKIALSYIVFPQDSSEKNQNYRAALIKYILPNVTITKLNEQTNPNGIIWNVAATRCKSEAEKVNITCTSISSSCTESVFPPLALPQDLATSSSQATKIEQVLKDIIEHIHQSEFSPLSYRPVPINTSLNQTETFALLKKLQEADYKLKGGVVFDQQQSILVRIENLNYLLCYGEKPFIQLMPMFDFDLDEGFSFNERNRTIFYINKAGSKAEQLIKDLQAQEVPQGFIRRYRFIDIDMAQASLNTFLAKNFEKHEILPILIVTGLQKRFLEWQANDYQGELIPAALMPQVIDKTIDLTQTPEAKPEAASCRMM